MNLRKRSLLIAALAALVFAAMAGLLFNRATRPVRADAGSVVTMRCSLGFGGVLYVDSSDRSVTLPNLGSECGPALHQLYAQGFKRQDAFSEDGSNLKHVLIRGE
jgi:hypothetical protein